MKRNNLKHASITVGAPLSALNKNNSINNFNAPVFGQNDGGTGYNNMRTRSVGSSEIVAL